MRVCFFCNKRASQIRLTKITTSQVLDRLSDKKMYIFNKIKKPFK